jgi:hypothetical protein
MATQEKHMGKLEGKIERFCLSDWRMCKAKDMVLPARKNPGVFGAEVNSD